MAAGGQSNLIPTELKSGATIAFLAVMVFFGLERVKLMQNRRQVVFKEINPHATDAEKRQMFLEWQKKGSAISNVDLRSAKLVNGRPNVTLKELSSPSLIQDNRGNLWAVVTHAVDARNPDPIRLVPFKTAAQVKASPEYSNLKFPSLDETNKRRQSKRIYSRKIVNDLTVDLQHNHVDEWHASFEDGFRNDVMICKKGNVYSIYGQGKDGLYHERVLTPAQVTQLDLEGVDFTKQNSFLTRVKNFLASPDNILARQCLDIANRAGADHFDIGGCDVARGDKNRRTLSPELLTRCDAVNKEYVITGAVGAALTLAKPILDLGKSGINTWMYKQMGAQDLAKQQKAAAAANPQALPGGPQRQAPRRP